MPPGHSKDMRDSQLEQPAPELRVQQIQRICCKLAEAGAQGQSGEVPVPASGSRTRVWGEPVSHSSCWVFSRVSLLCCVGLIYLQLAGVCPRAGLLFL